MKYKKGEGMNKKVKKTLDERIEDIIKQQRELERLFDKLQGFKEGLEAMKKEDDEKTD
jgi:hypothetical protein